MNTRSDPRNFPGRAMVIVTGLITVLYLGATGPPAEEKPKPSKPAEVKKKEGKEKGKWGDIYSAGRHKIEPSVAAASLPAGSAQRMNLAQMDCKACHGCETPTRENPCLRMCPRSVAEVIADAAHEVLPESVLLLHAFEWGDRRFMPVPFNHKGHADMAGMAGGCEVCHHHSSEGKLHPPCRTCHKPAFAMDSAEELRMPSLKGAYHRQCMGCHRDWAHNTKCSICHLPKGDTAEPSVDEILHEYDPALHPPIENPDHVPYKTEHEEGPNVMFRHREHVNLYGYECERCHRGDNCARCHEQAQRPREGFAEVEKETHGACFQCHEEDRCERCHSKKERPAPQRFDHSITGFPLEKYHGKLTCKACHKRLFFLRVLQSECSFCHKDWDTDTFNHAVTGQELDDNHADADCEDCHADGRFIRPPSCDECHDEDIVFPSKRPGPVAVPPKPAKKKD